MKEIKIEKVKIDKIQKHPDNPRTIEESKLEELKQSILEFPEMLELRPIIVEKETNYIIGGNQRHQACKELGHKEVFVIFIEETNKEKIKEFMLKDNMNYGVWNFELLKMFYDQNELIKWGLEDAEYIDFNEEDEDEEIEDNYEQEEAGDVQVIKKIVFVLEDKYYDQALNKLLDYSQKNEFSDNTEAILNLIERHMQEENTVELPDYEVYVISAGRHDKLPFSKKEKEKFIFCVKNGEGDKYRENGCKKVFETGKLMQSRNFALNHSYENKKYCVQLSDDIKKVRTNSNFTDKKEIDLTQAIEELVLFSHKNNVNLVGIPPTGNDFFAKEAVVKNAFCIGDCFVAKPCEVRFDEKLTLKEDYDYTLQHIEKGGVLRYQRLIFEFEHYTNKGGAVQYRNDGEEKKNIDYLKKKWGNIIRDNPKRENEILLKIKR